MQRARRRVWVDENNNNMGGGKQSSEGADILPRGSSVRRGRLEQTLDFLFSFQERGWVCHDDGPGARAMRYYEYHKSFHRRPGVIAWV